MCAHAASLPQVVLIWGVASVDRAGVDRCDEFDLGHAVFDTRFDAADPAAQRALLQGCLEPPTNPALRIKPGSTVCVVEKFHDWVVEKSGNASIWPLTPRAAFYDELQAFLLTHATYAGYASVERERSTGELRLRHVLATYAIAMQRHAPADEVRPLFDAWEAEAARINAAAPPTAGVVLHSARVLWVLMAVMELLLLYAKVRSSSPLLARPSACRHTWQAAPSLSRRAPRVLPASPPRRSRLCLG